MSGISFDAYDTTDMVMEELKLHKQVHFTFFPGILVTRAKKKNTSGLKIGHQHFESDMQENWDSDLESNGECEDDCYDTKYELSISYFIKSYLKSIHLSESTVPHILWVEAPAGPGNNQYHVKLRHCVLVIYGFGFIAVFRPVELGEVGKGPIRYSHITPNLICRLIKNSLKLTQFHGSKVLYIEMEQKPMECRNYCWEEVNRLDDQPINVNNLKQLGYIELKP